MKDFLVHTASGTPMEPLHLVVLLDIHQHRQDVLIFGRFARVRKRHVPLDLPDDGQAGDGAGLSVRHPHFFKAVQIGLTVLIVLRHKKTPPRDRLPVFGLFNAKKHPQSGDASFKP